MSALIKRAVDGDRAALGQLLYGSADDLTAFISRRLPDSVNAEISVEDIVQETFRDAFRGIGRFQSREDASFMSWLRTIAASRIQDALRAMGRKKRGGGRRRISHCQQDANESVMYLFDQLGVDDLTPSRRFSQQEALQCMRVALAELPDQYAEAIRLQFFEGKSHAEIAEAMGRSVSAVQGLIKRGKQALRDSLGNASVYLSSR